MPGQTPSQTVGPYFAIGLTPRLFGRRELIGNVLATADTPGEHIRLEGRVFDGAGDPVEDAMLEIWQADSQGYFNHPADPNHTRADPNFSYFGRADTVNNGIYTFKTVKPGRVPFDDSRDQAPHVNVRLFSRGLLTHAYTRIYFGDESEANQTDPVLNAVPEVRRHTLIALPQQSGDLLTYCFNIVLQGDGVTVFFNP